MELLYWLENQEEHKVDKLRRIIELSKIGFKNVDKINDGAEIIDWILQHKEESALVITDTAPDNDNLVQLIYSLHSGLIILISDTDYYFSKDNLKINRVGSIDQAISYYKNSFAYIARLAKRSELPQKNKAVEPNTEGITGTQSIDEELPIPTNESFEVELPFTANESIEKSDVSNHETNEKDTAEDDFAEAAESNTEEESVPQPEIVEKEIASGIEDNSEWEEAHQSKPTKTIPIPTTPRKSRYVVPIKNDSQEENNHLVEAEESIDIDLGTTKVEENIDTTLTESVLQETNYQNRKRNIQRQLFAKQKWTATKTVGIWSPLHRMGVTTFAMNFSFFLAENRIYTALLEGLTNQPSLKDWLKRYSKLPSNWKSYANTIQVNEEDPLSAEWKYRDVMCLPLDSRDCTLLWDDTFLESYMTTTNIMDITLVDFPTGKMEKYTEDALKYIDQLLIVVDDTFQDIVAWKDYIHRLQAENDISVQLIFNKLYDFSQVKAMEKELGYKVIATLPSLHEQVMRNYYDIEPLYFADDEVKSLLQPEYEKIAQYLFDNKFERKNKDSMEQKEKWSTTLLKSLKRKRLFGNIKR